MLRPQIIPRRRIRIPAALAAATTTAVLFIGVGNAVSIPGKANPASVDSKLAGTHEIPSVARGRYLVAVTGCNDCHTPGYGERGGEMPVTDWLTGQSVGFSGPWGTSYPANLRLTLQGLTESQWVVFARAERRPPMPWFSLKKMSDADLRDIYRFIRSLGPKGEPAPAAVAPGDKVETPFILFTPQTAMTTALSSDQTR
jgi:mono/diheme cytochrome c family protein